VLLSPLVSEQVKYDAPFKWFYRHSSLFDYALGVKDFEKIDRDLDQFSTLVNGFHPNQINSFFDKSDIGTHFFIFRYLIEKDKHQEISGYYLESLRDELISAIYFSNKSCIVDYLINCENSSLISVGLEVAGSLHLNQYFDDAIECLNSSSKEILLGAIKYFYFNKSLAKHAFPYLSELALHDDIKIKLAASECLVLQGERQYIDNLICHIDEDNYQLLLTSIMAYSDYEYKKSLISDLLDSNLKNNIKCAAICFSGTKDFIPNLISYSEDRTDNVLDHLEYMLGLNLESEGLTRDVEQPISEDFFDLSTYPDSDRLNKWWTNNEKNYPNEIIFGLKMDSTTVMGLWNSGTQAHRLFANHYLATRNSKWELKDFRSKLVSE
jgi:hypothetical protein